MNILKNTKYSLLLLCSFGFCMPMLNARILKDSNPVKLTNSIISTLDGKSWGINGEVIGLMLQIRHEIRKILYGNPDKETKSLTGLYEFNGALHSAISLAKIESECNAKYFSHEDVLIHDASMHTPQELQSIKCNYEKQKAELHKILVGIKEDFKRITKSYVEGARGFKDQMLILINESCELRGKDSCFLLKWGEAEEGRETEAFDKDIMTFEAMVTFFTDLMNFLEDMVNSCDKGREQFMEMVRSRKTQNN